MDMVPITEYGLKKLEEDVAFWKACYESSEREKWYWYDEFIKLKNGVDE